FRFCASVPYWTIARDTTPIPEMSASAVFGHPRATSSMANTPSRSDCPAPPYSVGMVSPVTSISASRRILSQGSWPFLSHSGARGLISLSTRSRIIRRSIRCSSLSLKSIASSLLRHRHSRGLDFSPGTIGGYGDPEGLHALASWHLHLEGSADTTGDRGRDECDPFPDDLSGRAQGLGRHPDIEHIDAGVVEHLPREHRGPRVTRLHGVGDTEAPLRRARSDKDQERSHETYPEIQIDRHRAVEPAPGSTYRRHRCEAQRLAHGGTLGPELDEVK